jgi:hypothetical protein
VGAPGIVIFIGNSKLKFMTKQDSRRELKDFISSLSPAEFKKTLKILCEDDEESPFLNEKIMLFMLANGIALAFIVIPFRIFMDADPKSVEFLYPVLGVWLSILLFVITWLMAKDLEIKFKKMKVKFEKTKIPITKENKIKIDGRMYILGFFFPLLGFFIVGLEIFAMVNAVANHTACAFTGGEFFIVSIGLSMLASGIILCSTLVKIHLYYRREKRARNKAGKKKREDRIMNALSKLEIANKLLR